MGAYADGSAVGPLVTYRMAIEDRPRLLRAMEIVARMGFSAGAREIAMPIFGLESLRSERELDDFVARPPAMCYALNARPTTRSGRPG